MNSIWETSWLDMFTLCFSIAAKALDEALGEALLRERQEQVNFKKHSYGFLK